MNRLQTEKDAEGERSPQIPVFEFLIHIVALLEAHDHKELVCYHVEIPGLC